MTSQRRILLVEDDGHVADVVGTNLRDEGFWVDAVADGLEAFQCVAARSYDLLILDWLVPGMNGLDLCTQFRKTNSHTPIMIVSGKAEESHRILGLELGADDYLTKPFSVLELVARVRALLRRVDALSNRTERDAVILEHGRLRVNLVAREVQFGDRAIDLTLREFDLLTFLMQNPGRVFSRQELLNRVWGYGHDGYEHTVNSHINRLRAKIEADPSHPQAILTVWGVGYKLGLPDDG